MPPVMATPPAQAVGSEYTLRVLHLSDLHCRGERELEPWKRRRVLGPAWDDNLQEILQDGPIDLLCFTGDIADWGRADEYGAATEFFDSLLKRTGLAKERLFLVPGNHDVDRSIAPESWRQVRQALARGTDEQDFSRWMNRLKDPPPGFHPEWREDLLARQSAYREWLRGPLGRPQLDPASSPHGTLGFRVSLSLPDFPFPVHVIGFDTAWLCGDDSDSGRLRLTDHQLSRLCTDAQGESLSGLRLGLMHHPLSDLADAALLRSSLRGRLDLLLRGHLHDSEIVTEVHPDQSLHQLAAGCLYEGDRADSFHNSCQCLTLHLDGRGQIRRATIHFRTWSPSGGHWHDDDSRHNASRGGRLPWLGPAITAIEPTQPDVQSAPQPGFDPWTPAVPPNFVGRSYVMQELRHALQQRRGVSLVGDWRIGKSSVLLTWHKWAQAEHPAVFWLSGESAAGVSPAAWVQALTGLPAPDGADAAANQLEQWLRTCPAPPLILFDEADGPLRRFDVRFFERLRGLLGRLCLVLASRQPIDLLYADRGLGSPFANVLQLLTLGLFSPNEATELLCRAAGSLSSTDTALLRHWAGEHPFYLTLFARHLLSARGNGESEDVALRRFQTEASARLRELWHGALSDSERGAILRCTKEAPAPKRSLCDRGILRDNGLPFGHILTWWLQEQDLL